MNHIIWCIIHSNFSGNIIDSTEAELQVWIIPYGTLPYGSYRMVHEGFYDWYANDVE